MGREKNLICGPGLQSPVLLDAEYYRALACCNAFRDIEGHTNAIIRRLSFPEEQRARAHQMVLDFIDSNLLVATSRLLQCSVPRPPHSVPRVIDNLAIVTANRFAQLHQCLHSFVAHLQKYGRSCEVAVMDDTRDVAARNVAREFIRQYRCPTRIRLRYGGYEEKVEYTRSLTRLGIPGDIAHFALFGLGDEYCSTGGNRNAALMHAAGALMLCADDDVLCRLTMLDAQVPARLAIAADASTSFQSCFFSDREAAIANSIPSEADVLKIHEQILGASLSGLVEAFLAASGGVDIGRASSKTVDRLLEGKGHVPITLSGVVGDSGMPTGAVFLASSGATRTRFLESAEVYRRNRLSREVIHSVPRFTLAEAGLVTTTTLTGIDNRSVLVPFCPSFRSQDTLFGSTLLCTQRSAYLGHVPVALDHAAERGRRHAPLRQRLTVAGTLNSLVQATAAGRPDDDPDRALRSVGTSLMEWGRAKIQDFAAFVSSLSRAQTSNQIAYYEGLLRLYGYAPDYWAREVVGWIKDCESAVVEADYGIPYEFADMPAPAGWAKVRGVTFQFGSLLYWWPSFFEASLNLRRKERHLACIP
jgi:hypothetical protein